VSAATSAPRQRHVRGLRGYAAHGVRGDGAAHYWSLLAVFRHWGAIECGRGTIGVCLRPKGACTGV
jgi:hypothetical protein